jgi:CHAT domain-containing protein/tetratricopeptide (TPR) repeat protein
MRIVGIIVLLSLFLSIGLAGGDGEIQPFTYRLAALKVSVADTFVCLGNYYEKKQDLLPALNAYLNALSIYRSADYKSRAIGYLYFRMSSIFRLVNKTGLSHKYLQKAMDTAVKFRDHQLKVMVFNAYSKLHQEAGDDGQALRYIKRSLNSVPKGGPTYWLMEAYYQEYLVMKRMGKPRDAIRALERAVAEGIARDNFDKLLPILVELGIHRASSGDLNGAHDILENIDDIYAPFYPQYFFYYYLQAVVAQKKGDIQRAFAYFEKTHRRLSDYFSSFNSIGFYRYQDEIGRIYGRMIRFYLYLYRRTGNRLYIRKAIYFSEIQNGAHLEPLGTGQRSFAYLSRQNRILSDELSFYTARYKDCDKGDEDGRLLEFYKNKTGQLRRQISELNEMIASAPLQYKFYSLEDFDIGKIRRKIKHGQLVLKYCVLEEDAFVFWIDRRTYGVLKLSKPSSWILERIRQLTAPLDDFAGGRVDYLRVHFDLNVAGELYHGLLQEVLASRPDIDELLVIPGREFYDLPLEALVLDVNPGEPAGDAIFSEYRAVDYLVQKYAVSYFYSLFHLQKTFRCRLRQTDNVSVFANPVIDSQLFQPLPSSTYEAEQIRDIVGGGRCKVFLGEDFTLDNFEAFAPASRIIHLATHFINNTEYPNHSALLFSGPKDHPSFLYAHQLFQCTLDAQLVILSACETAEKSLRGLQGLRGMIAAFRKANVKSLMVSLWPVDEFSSRLQPAFYRHFKKDLNLSRSLQKAKLTLMNQQTTLANGLTISFAHPFIWSNFILHHNYL